MSSDFSVSEGISPSSLISALLRHRQEFAEIYAAGSALLETSDVSDKFSYAAQIVAALGPIAEDLMASMGNPGLMEGVDNESACGSLGLDWSKVEIIAGIIIKLLPILI